MDISSPPQTVTTTYRYIDVVFPDKTVSYTLTADDWLERKGDVLGITFADGTETEVFLRNALALEMREVTREEVLKTER